MRPENEATLQAIMDAAYDKAKAAGWATIRTHADHLDLLDMIERRVVVIGWLNYQVCNGGFHQWADNRYGSEWRATIRALEAVDGPACREVARLVQEVGGRLEYNRHGNLKYARNEWGDYDEGDDTYNFDEQDDTFYADNLNERMMDELADWVNAQRAAAAVAA